MRKSPEADLQIAAVEFIRTGRPVTGPQTPDDFWALVDRSAGPEACWPWLGRAVQGYGGTTWSFKGQRRRAVRAHRVAYFLACRVLLRGRDREALILRHRCDNRLCCNPTHLETGRHADNFQDQVDRGRHVPPPTFHGSDHPRAKLTWADVRDARARHAKGDGCASLARAYGVGETTMGHALAGRTWRDA